MSPPPNISQIEWMRDLCGSFLWATIELFSRADDLKNPLRPWLKRRNRSLAQHGFEPEAAENNSIPLKQLLMSTEAAMLSMGWLRGSPAWIRNHNLDRFLKSHNLLIL